MRIAALLVALVVVACSTVAPTPLVSPIVNPTVAPTAPVATTSPTAAPTPTPNSDGPLPAEVAAQLQEVLDGHAGERGVPSISASVIVPDAGTWSGAAGLAVRDGSVMATPETVYAIGSITKTFVAALILRLVEDGYLGLDDAASDHLGPISASKSNGATVRQLLAMRSGIDDYLTHVDGDFLDSAHDAAELIELIGAEHFAPDERFEYSNSNYLLLGLIAEVVTGGPVAELLHEYLLGPHDLDRTYYGAGESAPEPLAHGYNSLEDDARDFYDGSGQLPSATEASVTRSAGSMAATAPDIARWISALYGGQVLAPASQAQMLDFSVSDLYGLGAMRVDLPGAGEVIGHRGYVRGSLSAAFMAPDSGTVVVVLVNNDDFDVNAVLDDLFVIAGAATP
ncbi:MAG: serine hydrolase [Chloroflexota bacterium]